MGQKENVWVDIKSVLQNGVKSLSMGEMVSVPNFNLHEAVSAAEIGDPRMDPPLQHDMQKDSLVEQGRLQLDLTLPQQAALLDELLIKLVQWWKGHHPYLTLYTSLHLAAIDKIPEDKVVLRATVDVVQGLIDLTRDIYHLSGVISDEDTPVAGLVDHPVTDAPMINTSVPSFAAAAEALQGDADTSAQAVSCRLEFLHTLFCVLNLFIQASPKSLDKARAQLQQAKAGLEAISSTQAAIAGTEAPCMYPDLYLMYMNAPTPSVQPLTHEGACCTMRASLDCLLEACNLRNLTDFRAVMLLAEHVVVSCDLAVMRGALSSLILPPMVDDDDEMPDWSPTPRRFVQQLHLPFSLTSQAPTFKLFLDQVSIAVSNYLQSICNNRSRMRRKLEGNFQDWSRMVAHARNADASEELRSHLFSKKSQWELHPNDEGPCSMWICHLASAGMLQYLLLGFELELYSPSEFIVVFSYCKRVLELQSVSLQRMTSCRPKELKPPPKKGKNKAAAHRPEITPGEYQRLCVERHYIAAADAMRVLCSAYMQLCAAVAKIGMVKHRDPTFGSDELRYQQRFQCFAVFTATRIYVPYEMMKAETDATDFTVVELLDQARLQFHEADDRIRSMLAQTASQKLQLQHWEEGDWKATAQVAKRNFTACGLLKMSIDNISAFSASWDQTAHKQLPTLSIKRV